jgi:hypothetical protein
MTTHNVPTIPSPYTYQVGHFKSDATVIIEGSNNPAGWGAGGWDATGEGRLEFCGPLVKGPCAFLYGLCSVIDNRGGTGRLHREAEEAGLMFRAKDGDTFVMEGTEYTLTVDRRGYPTLTAK